MRPMFCWCLNARVQDEREKRISRHVDILLPFVIEGTVARGGRVASDLVVIKNIQAHQKCRF